MIPPPPRRPFALSCRGPPAALNTTAALAGCFFLIDRAAGSGWLLAASRAAWCRAFNSFCVSFFDGATTGGGGAAVADRDAAEADSAATSACQSKLGAAAGAAAVTASAGAAGAALRPRRGQVKT